jgi:hypothetical protein
MRHEDKDAEKKYKTSKVANKEPALKRIPC